MVKTTRFKTIDTIRTAFLRSFVIVELIAVSFILVSFVFVFLTITVLIYHNDYVLSIH
jgi:hypothetical protein